MTIHDQSGGNANLFSEAMKSINEFRLLMDGINCNGPFITDIKLLVGVTTSRRGGLHYQCIYEEKTMDAFIS